MVIETYIVKHKDLSTRLQARSGGVFQALAAHYLGAGEVVYGCAVDENFCAEHIRIDLLSDLYKLAGSKYIQSKTHCTYKMVEKDLASQRHVLYSGTACQIDGLKKYLLQKRVDTERLMTVDIVCHGVPSPEIWKAFLKWSEDRYHGKITNVNFRDKSYGWESHFETLEINGKKYAADYFKEMFYRHYTLRPSCYICPYCNTKRVGDITIADAWGVDYGNQDFNDGKGCSLVIINSNKGNQVFKKVLKILDFRQVDLEQFMQPNLKKPSSCPSDRQRFWDEYRENGFLYISRKYGGNTIRGRAKSEIKKLIGKFGLTNVVKRILRK